MSLIKEDRVEGSDIPLRNGNKLLVTGKATELHFRAHRRIKFTEREEEGAKGRVGEVVGDRVRGFEEESNLSKRSAAESAVS